MVHTNDGYDIVFDESNHILEVANRKGKSASMISITNNISKAIWIDNNQNQVDEIATMAGEDYVRILT